MASILTDAQVESILLNAGLRSERWLTDDEVELIAYKVEAISTGGVYDVTLEDSVSIECIRRVIALGVMRERGEELRHRIVELLRGVSRVAPATPSGGTPTPSGDGVSRADFISHVSNTLDAHDIDEIQDGVDTNTAGLAAHLNNHPAGGGGGISESEAQALIDAAGHASQTDLTATQNELNTEEAALVNHIANDPHGGSGGGLTNQQVQTLIDNAGHASQTDLTATQTDLDTEEAALQSHLDAHPSGGGISESEAQTLIDNAGHASAADVSTVQTTANDAAGGVALLEENAFVTAVPNSTGFTLGRLAGAASVDVDLSGIIPEVGGGGTSDYDDLTDKPILNMSPAVASADTADVLIWDDAAKTLYRTIGHAHTGRAVTWEKLPEPTSLDAHAAYPATQYQGTRNSDHPQNWLIGYSYFIRQGSYWTYRNATGHGANYQPPQWKGAPNGGSRADAESNVSAVDDIACFIFDPDDDNRVFPYRVLTITPGTPETWRVQAVGYVDPGRLLPDPTGHDGDTVEANEDGTGYHLVHSLQPDDFIPHVGRIPDPVDITADSPDLLFLSHTYSKGQPQDATMTVGFAGGLAGFGAATPGPAFGSMSEPSPIVRLFGIGSAADYNLETLSAFSKTFIDEVAMVRIKSVNYALGQTFREGALFSRRLQNFPENLSDAELDINIIMTDTEAYFTTGVGDVFNRNLYGKLEVDEGYVYDEYAITTRIHSTGTGPPTESPTRPNLTYQNSLAQVWVGGGTYVYHAVDPTGTSEAFTHEKYVAHPSTRTEIFSVGGDGGFTWVRNLGVSGFSQWQGAQNYVEGLLFREVWNYLAEHIYPTGSDHDDAIALRDHGFFAGGFHHQVEALRVVDIALAGDPFVEDRYFWGGNTVGNSGLKLITTFVPGTVSRSDTFFWRGPLATTQDITTYFEANSYVFTKDELVEGSNITITADDADQTLTISAADPGDTFTRYATEADVPADVPAGTVAWWPV